MAITFGGLALAFQLGGPDSVAFRPTGRAEGRLGLGGSVVTTEGNSVASARVALERAKPPYPIAYAEAEYMSVGPPGPMITDTTMIRGTTGAPSLRLVTSHFHRLRVTLGRCESVESMTIDDIVTGRADTRSVVAEYTLRPYIDPNVRDLWTALQGAPHVRGPDPSGPPIVWRGPAMFARITRSDTVVVEQLDSTYFQVTLRARVR